MLCTLTPHYQTVPYKMVLYLRWFQDGPKSIVSQQKYIDYIEK